jgi:hypothetical protein
MGIWRCARSKKTMVATVARTMVDDRREVQGLDVALVRREVAGDAVGDAVDDAGEDESEIPLPMPRSVICSPTHIMKAVPVVSVSMLMRRKPQPGVGDDVADVRRVDRSPLFIASRLIAMPKPWTSDRTMVP